MTLDDARRQLPHLGFAVYAFTPGGDVTLEIYGPDGTIFTFVAPTEQEALARAFPEQPEPAPETSIFD